MQQQKGMTAMDLEAENQGKAIRGANAFRPKKQVFTPRRLPQCHVWTQFNSRKFEK